MRNVILSKANESNRTIERSAWIVSYDRSKKKVVDVHLEHPFVDENVFRGLVDINSIASDDGHVEAIEFQR